MNRLQELRLQKKLNMKEVAAALKIPYTTYVNYEKGAREPNSEMLITLANFYQTTIDYILGKSPVLRVTDVTLPANCIPLPETTDVPLVGNIACGAPILAEENIERMVSIPAEWHADFTLICKGSSMEPRIRDGDLVAIRCQPAVENGEIAAVLIDCEATLKHVFLSEDRIILQPENPEYAPIVKVGVEMNEVKIEGKAVGLCRGL